MESDESIASRHMKLTRQGQAQSIRRHARRSRATASPQCSTALQSLNQDRFGHYEYGVSYQISVIQLFLLMYVYRSDRPGTSPITSHVLYIWQAFRSNTTSGSAGAFFASLVAAPTTLQNGTLMPTAQPDMKRRWRSKPV